MVKDQKRKERVSGWAGVPSPLYWLSLSKGRDHLPQFRRNLYPDGYGTAGLEEPSEKEVKING